jgi:hypothetical protein
MAKGNIGNILQHYLAICAAEHLADRHGQKGMTSKDSHRKIAQTLEYIDLFAMAPWEPIESEGRRWFAKSIEWMEVAETPMARTFREAWRCHYENDADGLPNDSPYARGYPNTATLILTGLHEESWRMRLHEVCPIKRHYLRDWARLQSPAHRVKVGARWQESRLLSTNPARGPVLILLDPHRITNNRPKPGLAFLSEKEIKKLIGPNMLDIAQRPASPDADRAIIVALSYSDPDPGVPSDIVHRVFAPLGWKIDVIRVDEPGQGGVDLFHQGWWIASHDDVRPSSAIVPFAMGGFEEEWNLMLEGIQSMS